MAGSSGNGKAGTLRERFAHNQAERERAIDALDDDPDDITGQDLLDAMKAGAAIATEATGRHQALQAIPPPPPAPSSGAPQVAKGFVYVMREANTWPKVAALALLVLLVIAAWRVGVALTP